MRNDGGGRWPYFCGMFLHFPPPPGVTQGRRRGTGNVCREDDALLDVGDMLRKTQQRLIVNAKQPWQPWREGFVAPKHHPLPLMLTPQTVTNDSFLYTNVILHKSRYKTRLYACQNVTKRACKTSTGRTG